MQEASGLARKAAGRERHVVNATHEIAMPHDESSRSIPEAIAETESLRSVLRAALDVREPLGIERLAETGPKPGDVLSDRFVLERLVGSGGMGVIHRATDLVTRQAVAIKMIARPDPSYATRFEREVAVLAKL